MARLRNITDQALDLRVTGQTVQPDELIEVPDDVFDAYAWPETVWKVTSESTDTKKKG